MWLRKNFGFESWQVLLRAIYISHNHTVCPQALGFYKYRQANQVKVSAMTLLRLWDISKEPPGFLESYEYTNQTPIVKKKVGCGKQKRIICE